MKALSEFTNIYIHRNPVDMRKGINGLSEVVQQMAMGSFEGEHLFVFCGRRKNSIKVLYFDKSGFALWQKRLERDRFHWPSRLTEDVVTIDSEQMKWLLEGYNFLKMRPFSEIKIERVC